MQIQYQSPLLLMEGTSNVGAKCMPLQLLFSSSVQLSSRAMRPGWWALRKLCMSPTVCQSKQFRHSTENSVWILWPAELWAWTRPRLITIPTRNNAIILSVFIITYKRIVMEFCYKDLNFPFCSESKGFLLSLQLRVFFDYITVKKIRCNKSKFFNLCN